MAFVVTTDAATGVSQTSCTFNGHWTGATDDGFGFSVDAKFVWGYGAAGPNDTGEVNYATETGSHADTPAPSTLDRDRTVTFEFRARDQDGGFINSSGPLTVKTHAPVMVFGTPNVAATRDTEADVDINFTANTFESVASVKVQYKLDTEPTVWTDGTNIGGLFGFGVVNLDFTITGLLANTLYDFRFVALRDTANDTSLTSAEGQFTTSPIPSGGMRCFFLG